MRNVVARISTSFVLLLAASAGMADAVELVNHRVTSSRQGQLELKSTTGVKFRITYIKQESAIEGAESGTRVTDVRVEVIEGASQFADVRATYSTTCTRVSPVRGTAFGNQRTPELRFQTSPHSFPTLTIPLAATVLRKNIHGGEGHVCEANFQANVDGDQMVDPINGTDTFHPQF